MIKNIAILIPSLMLGGAEKQAALLAMVLNKHYNVYMYILYGDKIVAPQKFGNSIKNKCTYPTIIGKFYIKSKTIKKKLEQNRTELLLNYLYKLQCDRSNSWSSRRCEKSIWRDAECPRGISEDDNGQGNS